MRTIIAGSRSVRPDDVWDAMDLCPWSSDITVVLSGTARGADKYGEQWARERRRDIESYPANWKMYGRRAGFIRNRRMAENADSLVAVWDGESRGTRHMIRIAHELGLRVFVHYCGHR